MPKLGISYCVDVMNQIKEWGFELRVSGADINRAIQIHAGVNPRTREKYFKLLQEFGFIKIAENNPGFFDIDWDNIKKYAR